MRRPEDNKECLIGEYPIVAIKPFAYEESVVLEALLGARSTEVRRGRIELDLKIRQ